MSLIMRATAALQTLIPIEGHPSIGPKLYVLRGAILGVDGMTEEELIALENIAARWSELPEKLRTFYASNIDNKTAQVSIGRIIWGGAPLEGWQYAILSKLWRDTFLTSSNMELCPRKQ